MSEDKVGQVSSGEDEANEVEDAKDQGDAIGPPSEEEAATCPRKRAIIFAAGLFLLVVGFLVLNQANQAADNWAGKISPLMILGGYGVIFWSLWI